ncbi:MAG: phytanoyl-CoA dioxygenase family protein [Caldilineaceae bacterium SB0661_bin_32]|uniref:Phytanoyl-CoA dioxygenase family protein n=1 Tax=Caldilineaceae bacterium SB0661_bin_32 TaxID=2605255 RepID=A0A6B1DCP0_9CHLR|nr:phytanoyl-CoA dioxygenase family protein [Caldilineaceae bacterium SB0661_bin_32]
MASLQQAFWEMDVYGFTLLEGVLSAAEVEALRASLAEWAARLGGEQRFLGQAGHVSNLPVLDPLYHPLIDHPRTLPVIEHVLGKQIILGSLNARIVRPGDPVQGLHSDIRADLLNMGSPVMVNTVWLLDSFTPENGSTRIVPGSHRSGMAGPPEGMDVKHVHQLVAPAGSVLVFNGQCWHGGGANRTQTDRHALFGHYRKSALIFQVDPHDGFQEDWLNDLTPRQRELLRMDNGLAAPHAADSHLRVSFSRGKKMG